MAELSQAERRSAVGQPPSEIGDAPKSDAPLIVMPDAATPITARGLRDYLYVEHDEDDALLESLRDSAIQHIEQYTGRLARHRLRYAAYERVGCRIPDVVEMPEEIHAFTPSPTCGTAPTAKQLFAAYYDDQFQGNHLDLGDLCFAPNLMGADGMRLWSFSDWPEATDHAGTWLQFFYVPRTIFDDDSPYKALALQALRLLVGGGYEHRESDTIAVEIRTNPTIYRVLEKIKNLSGLL